MLSPVELFDNLHLFPASLEQDNLDSDLGIFSDFKGSPLKSNDANKIFELWLDASISQGWGAFKVSKETPNRNHHTISYMNVLMYFMFCYFLLDDINDPVPVLRAAE